MNSKTAVEDLSVVFKLYYPKLKPLSFHPINHGLGGQVFKVTTKSGAYILKLFPAKAKNLQKTFELQSYMHNLGLKIMPIVKDVNGNMSHSTPNLTSVVYEYCQGLPIGWGLKSETLLKDIAPALAGEVSKLHCLEVPNFFDLKKRVDIPEISEDSTTDIRKAHKYCKDYLSGNKLSGFRVSLIHCDLTRENILINSKRQLDAIIDFDDAKIGVTVYDLATLLTQVYISKTHGINWQGINSFLKTYLNLVTLSSSEIQSIYYLLLLRNLEILRIESILDQPNRELLSIISSVKAKISLIIKEQKRFEDLLSSFINPRS